MDAMEAFKKQGIQNLVLDLRDNGGGLMKEAVDITDEFLDGDKLIVYTEGLHEKKREYRCKRPGIFEKGGLVVLVNERSASASEVVSGALQDWCRAKVIGRRTFGKGLVQDQYSLSDGSGIRLTIARYYTPLGRSIQRPYAKGKKIYMDEIMERYNDGELSYADSNKVTKGKAFITTCNDTVYGSGGIMPDVFVGIDTAEYSQQLNELLTGNALSSYVYHYYLQHKQQMEQYGSAEDFAQQFNAAGLWNGFAAYPAGITAKQKEKVQQRMKALLARFRWRNAGYYRVLNNNDPLLNIAVQQL